MARKTTDTNSRKVLVPKEKQVMRELWCNQCSKARKHIVQYEHNETFNENSVKEVMVFFHATCVICQRNETNSATRGGRVVQSMHNLLTHTMDRWNALLTFG